MEFSTADLIVMLYCCGNDQNQRRSDRLLSIADWIYNTKKLTDTVI